MYGEEVISHYSGRIAATAMTAIALEAGTGAILTVDCPMPGTVLYWGYKPTVAFSYATKTALGIMTLYRYTKKIQTAVLGNAGGAGYAVGDLLSVTQAGASGGKLRVLTVNAGAVLTVEIVNRGVNYVAGSNLATVALNGSGNNAFTVTISDKLALDTLALTDPADDADFGIVRKQYMRRVPNALDDDVSPTPAPPACFDAGEQLVIEITTAATGGGGIAGDFQTILVTQNRGENFTAQGLWVEANAS
jgi:hypothetical protein